MIFDEMHKTKWYVIRYIEMIIDIQKFIEYQGRNININTEKHISKNDNIKVKAVMQNVLYW